MQSYAQTHITLSPLAPLPVWQPDAAQLNISTCRVKRVSLPSVKWAFTMKLSKDNTVYTLPF